MPCHSHYGHGSKTSNCLHFGSKCANDCSRHNHLAKSVASNTKTGEQVGIEVLGHRIEQLRRGCNSIFAYGIAGEHITEGIGDEQYLVGIGKG